MSRAHAGPVLALCALLGAAGTSSAGEVGGDQEIGFDEDYVTPKEKERIIRAGGRVFAVEYDDGIDGPPRVWLGHMDVPGLAMSR